MKSKLFLTLLVMLCTAGCSIHPIQKDVTKISSTAIVHQIKCEAQRSIQDKAIGLLINNNKSRGLDPDLRLVRIGEDLLEHREKFKDKNYYRMLPPKALNFYLNYIETAIAWEFMFDITEEDMTSAMFDPVGLISGGNLLVTLKASNDLKRQNVRKFVVSDTFDGLLHNLECSDPNAPDNFQYPISGSIGLGELIDTFIDLNENYVLRPEKDDLDKDTTNFVPVFAETLRYTTTLSGSVNPVLTLNPIGRGLHLMDASITGMAMRTDIHSVIIGLSLKPTASLKSTSGKTTLPFADLQPTRSVFAKRTIRSGSAEERAIQAITQQRLDTFLDRFGTVNGQ